MPNILPLAASAIPASDNLAGLSNGNVSASVNNPGEAVDFTALLQIKIKEAVDEKEQFLKPTITSLSYNKLEENDAREEISDEALLAEFLATMPSQITNSNIEQFKTDTKAVKLIMFDDMKGVEVDIATSEAEMFPANILSEEVVEGNEVANIGNLNQETPAKFEQLAFTYHENEEMDDDFPALNSTKEVQQGVSPKENSTTTLQIEETNEKASSIKFGDVLEANPELEKHTSNNKPTKAEYSAIKLNQEEASLVKNAIQNNQELDKNSNEPVTMDFFVEEPIASMKEGGYKGQEYGNESNNDNEEFFNEENEDVPLQVRFSKEAEIVEGGSRDRESQLIESNNNYITRVPLEKDFSEKVETLLASANFDIAKESSPFAQTEKINFAIHEAFKNNEHQIIVKLEPAELGKVQINMELENGNLKQISMKFERVEAFDALKRDLSNLASLLSGSKIATENTWVELSHNDPNMGQHSQQHSFNDQHSNQQNQYSSNEELGAFERVAFKEIKANIETYNQAQDALLIEQKIAASLISNKIDIQV